MRKIPVTVLGATGSVGQRFVALLAEHPWFELAALAASERSAGKSYGEAAPWVQSTPLPKRIAALPVSAASPESVPPTPLVFSSLDAEVAGPVEREFAAAGALVISNAKSHRMDPDVPLVVPEVNADHLALVLAQRRARGGAGAIVTNPNCSTIGLALALKPLVDAFGVSRVGIVTLQAVSGAGLPGLPSLRILDNVIPFIAGEEEKIEAETCKILGRLEQDRIVELPLTLSAQCNRVPVVDGHTLCVSVGLERRADLSEVLAAFDAFPSASARLELPSAPARPIVRLDAVDGPQPRLHRELEGGMAAVVGRVRPCPLLDFKFVVLSHNTLRGAARGALLVGELAVKQGLVAHAEALSVARPWSARPV